MYRIEFVDIDTKLKNFLKTDDFENEVGRYMQSFLTKPEWEYKYWGDKKIKLKVDKDSVTYRFLQKYSRGDNLHYLLVGGLKKQMDIIKDVYNGVPNDKHPAGSFSDAFIRISKRIKDYRKKDKSYDTKAHDDFNSIMRCIFEDNIYNNSQNNPHIDKDAFVKRLGLRVCPYCGRQYIYGITPERDGKGVKVKPQIDHLFPKSIYPFLAINFFNLIPCCQACNLEPAKGDQDVLTQTVDGKLIINHPYEFDDKSLTFCYNLKSDELFNVDDIEINVDYHGNKILKDGYNKLFFIDEYYKYHNQEAHDIYLRLKATIYDGSKKSYDALGLGDDFWTHLPLFLFGYSLREEEAAKRPLYKFNKDIYHEMIDDFRKGKLI